MLAPMTISAGRSDRKAPRSSRITRLASLVTSAAPPMPDWMMAKFVAAQAAQRFRLSHDRPQALRDGAQQRIADGMAERVVHRPLKWSRSRQSTAGAPRPIGGRAPASMLLRKSSRLGRSVKAVVMRQMRDALLGAPLLR